MSTSLQGAGKPVDVGPADLLALSKPGCFSPGKAKLLTREVVFSSMAYGDGVCLGFSN
jgi:hypothetical protein